MEKNIYIYIIVSAVVTYLIRALPLVLVQGEIKNKTIRSFLYYVPYATLAAMTFPSILSASDSAISSAAGFAAAVISAYRGGSLIKVALIACITVFIIEKMLFLFI